MARHGVGDVTRRKARQMLHEGIARGRRLSSRQRGLFGAIASGQRLRKPRRG